MAELWWNRALHPMGVGFDDKMSTIGMITFPAITLCPAARIAVNKLNLTEIHNKFYANWPNSIENATMDELNEIHIYDLYR